MNIDTKMYRQVSKQLNKHCISLPLKKAALSSRHQDIVARMQQLSSFCTQSAQAYEDNENSLLSMYKGYVNTSGSIRPYLEGVINKDGKILRASGSIDCAASQFAYNHKTKNSRLNIEADVGKFAASGSADVHVWKDKVFDPSLYLAGSASFSILSGSASFRLGNSHIHADASASGQAGVAYANAQAVLNKSEQKLNLDVGVAALQGEVKSSFSFFNAKVTLTGSGSIGSAQANISYHHKQKEWEFGSKMGFICGLGFKVKVEY